ATMEAVRRSIRELDPHLVIAELRTLSETTSVALALPRVGASLLGAFGGIGLLLAMLGLYAVIAYTIAQRTGEIGIRMALGADRTRILGGVLAGGLRLVVIGIALGLAAAVATTHLLASMLYGVSPTDPATLIAVPILFLVVAAAATLGPAWRASRVHPATALRHE
ncbi:MAG: FtsX-like permease family protein, partial [Acidobacteriota bacterium]